MVLRSIGSGIFIVIFCFLSVGLYFSYPIWSAVLLQAILTETVEIGEISVSENYNRTLLQFDSIFFKMGISDQHNQITKIIGVRRGGYKILVKNGIRTIVITDNGALIKTETDFIEIDSDKDEIRSKHGAFGLAHAIDRSMEVDKDGMFKLSSQDSS